jgi:hypothetical protein
VGGTGPQASVTHPSGSPVKVTQQPRNKGLDTAQNAQGPLVPRGGSGTLLGPQDQSRTLAEPALEPPLMWVTSEVTSAGQV